MGILEKDGKNIPSEEKMVGKIMVQDKEEKKILFDSEEKKLDFSPKLTIYENNLAVEKLENYMDLFANKPEKI